MDGEALSWQFEPTLSCHFEVRQLSVTLTATTTSPGSLACWKETPLPGVSPTLSARQCLSPSKRPVIVASSDAQQDRGAARMSEETSQPADQPTRLRAARAPSAPAERERSRQHLLPRQRRRLRHRSPHQTRPAAIPLWRSQRHWPGQHLMSHLSGGKALRWYLSGWKSTRPCSKTMQRSMRVANV